MLGFSSFLCLPGMGAVCVEEGSKAVGIANTSISVHPREAGKQTQVCLTLVFVSLRHKLLLVTGKNLLAAFYQNDDTLNFKNRITLTSLI